MGTRTLEETPWDENCGVQPLTCACTPPGSPLRAFTLESPDNLKFRDASLRFLRRLMELGTASSSAWAPVSSTKSAISHCPKWAPPISPATTYAAARTSCGSPRSRSRHPQHDLRLGASFLSVRPGRTPVAVVAARLSVDSQVGRKLCSDARQHKRLHFHRGRGHGVAHSGRKQGPRPD